MGDKVVIVESPAKAKTIQKYLGKGYRVTSSMGHVRDLPKRDLSIDVEHNFEPVYEVTKPKVVSDLRQAIRGADAIYLATDPDREGEAIAWHITQAVNVPERTPIYRVVFQEITRSAVQQAINNPREIDGNLVDAQQARRVLDRLVGYQLSPLLWDKVKRGLSAGRVQSVAVRLIVEREQSIEAFVAQEYWSIEADLAKQGGATKRDAFRAVLIERDGKKLDKFAVENKEQADAIITDLGGARYVVQKIVRRDKRRSAAPPFTTSTLQQEAGRKLGFSAKKTMTLAQRLYEGVDIGGEEGTVGLITYMRTDSTNVAAEAQQEARAVIGDLYGFDYLPDKPPVYKTRAKGAQEAHEAIRPTSSARRPEQVASKLDRDMLRLYDLIWKRFVASQMAPAVFDSTTVDIGAFTRDTGTGRHGDTGTGRQGDTGTGRHGDTGTATGKSHPVTQSPSHRVTESPSHPVTESPSHPVTESPSHRVTQSPSHPVTQSPYTFRATGSVLKFPGFLAVYNVSLDEGEEDEDRERRLPPLAENELLSLLALLPIQHFTEPPPRFTEASLVKELEQLGIGRPSTYASIISTIQDREYVELSEKKLIPTTLGRVVTDLLVKHFPKIVDYDFTSSLEQQLDDIADGAKRWVPVLREFYGPFQATLATAKHEMRNVKREEIFTDVICPKCDQGRLAIKFGRNGEFLACSRYSKKSEPESCDFTSDFHREPDGTIVIDKASAPETSDVMCNLCGKPMVIKKSRFGPFLGCSGYPECANTRRMGKDGKPVPLPVPTGVACPKCSEGELMGRRGKFGRPFYGCSRYPKCDYATNSLDPLAAVVHTEPVAKPESAVVKKPAAKPVAKPATKPAATPAATARRTTKKSA